MQHSEKVGRQDRMEEKLRYHYQYHHNYLSPPLPPPPPPNSYRSRGGGRKVGRKNPRKLSHTLIHAHSYLDQEFEKALVAACRALKLISQLFNRANSSGKGPTHLESGQLIWKGANSSVKY